MCFSIFFLFNYITLLSQYFIGLLLILSLVTLYLDDFKLSNVKLLKFIQIFSLIFISFYIIYCIYNLPLIWNVIICINDNNDINLHSHITVDKNAGKEIGRGLNTIGTNIGLGASITGLGMAVSKCLVKTSMPPFQKAAVVVAGGVLGAATHSAFSNMNKARVLDEQNSISSNSTNISSNITTNITKLIDDNIVSSPLENLLLNIEIISSICLSLLIILTIQIIMKFYISKNFKLNMSNIFGISINKKIEYYINKIIILNKNMSNIYIFIILILLFYSLGLLLYISTDIYSNIDMYISVHNNLK
jgi:hypothetical protein